eukprot:728412-Pyramimonas_sp.AAC.1
MAVTKMMMTWLWRRRKWHALGTGGAGARQPGSKERPETGTPPLSPTWPFSRRLDCVLGSANLHTADLVPGKRSGRPASFPVRLRARP